MQVPKLIYGLKLVQVRPPHPPTDPQGSMGRPGGVDAPRPVIKDEGGPLDWVFQLQGKKPLGRSWVP